MGAIWVSSCARINGRNLGILLLFYRLMRTHAFVNWRSGSLDSQPILNLLRHFYITWNLEVLKTVLRLANMLRHSCVTGRSMTTGTRGGAQRTLPTNVDSITAGAINGLSLCWFSPCSEGCSLGSPVSLPPEKKNIPKLQFALDRGPPWERAILYTSKEVFIFHFYFYFVTYL